jgi:hypothetical protein
MPGLCALLAGATFAPRLRRLSLAFCMLMEDALDRLTASPGLRNLEAVDLVGCNALGAAAIRTFLGSRPPGRLTDLGLPYGLDLRELGAWPGLGDLRALRLWGATREGGLRTMSPDGRTVSWTLGRNVREGEWLGLFRSPHLHPVRFSVYAEAVPDDALAELFQRDWLAGIRGFGLDTNRWGRPTDREVLTILLKRDTPHLHEVGLSAAANLPRRQLAAWPTLPRLTQFDIGEDDRDTDLVRWVLSRAPLTPRVPRINLDERCNTDAAVRALAASPWARGVSHLDFGYNKLTPQKVARLAAAPFARHLESLHLGSERGDEEGLAALKAIAEERNFPRLRDVVVGSDSVEGGIDVLRRRFGPRLRVWDDC